MATIRRAQLIWITVTNGTTMQGAWVPFRDQPELHNVLVDGISTMDDVSLAYSPDGIPSISAVAQDQAKILLTLAEGSNLRVRQQPWALANQNSNFGYYMELQPFTVNWQRSDVLVTAPLAKDSTAIPLMVFYRFPNE